MEGGRFDGWPDASSSSFRYAKETRQIRASGEAAVSSGIARELRRDPRLLLALDDEAALGLALPRLERVDHPVAGHVEQAAVGDHRVVGAVGGFEDQLPVGGPEAEGLRRLQVADVEDVPDHAARARDRAVR